MNDKRFIYFSLSKLVVGFECNGGVKRKEQGSNIFLVNVILFRNVLKNMGYTVCGVYM